MPTTNEEILDRYIRHQTYLLRYSGGLRNEVLPYLASTEGELYDALIKWVTKIEGNRTMTGIAGRKWQNDFSKAISLTRAPAWDEVSDTVLEQLRQLAINEAAVGASIIQGASPVALGLTLPSAAKLTAIVNSQPFEGSTLKQWMKRTEAADVERMLAYAKVGIVQGQTPTQIARGIIGTKAAGYRDGIARKSFKNVESVILTLTNGIQNEAKQALYEANKDIIEREMFVATLDARTTIECASYDGKTFKQGTGPIPPLHFRCRSLRVPYLNPSTLNNRGFDSNTEKELVQSYSKKAGLGNITSRGRLPRGHKGSFDNFAMKQKRALIGQVPAQTTYNEWLKKQTKAFQDQVLGPTRADMFRKGDISLSKFVARDGDIYTLDELKRLGLWDGGG